MNNNYYKFLGVLILFFCIYTQCKGQHGVSGSLNDSVYYIESKEGFGSCFADLIDWGYVWNVEGEWVSFLPQDELKHIKLDDVLFDVQDTLVVEILEEDSLIYESSDFRFGLGVDECWAWSLSDGDTAFVEAVAGYASAMLAPKPFVIHEIDKIMPLDSTPITFNAKPFPFILDGVDTIYAVVYGDTIPYSKYKAIYDGWGLSGSNNNGLVCIRPYVPIDTMHEAPTTHGIYLVDISAHSNIDELVSKGYVWHHNRHNTYISHLTEQELKNLPPNDSSDSSVCVYPDSLSVDQQLLENIIEYLEDADRGMNKAEEELWRLIEYFKMKENSK